LKSPFGFHFDPAGASHRCGKHDPTEHEAFYRVGQTVVLMRLAIPVAGMGT
jgi:hypothetical protein